MIPLHLSQSSYVPGRKGLEEHGRRADYLALGEGGATLPMSGAPQAATESLQAVAEAGAPAGEEV
jgi:hypothetical protein